jgi:peroxiredoxin
MKKRLISVIVILGAAMLFAACEKTPELAAVGKPAPDFSLVDRQGRTWKLSALRGQVVFVNFWATWCPPCLQEMPSMQKLFSSMPQDRFKMLAILYKDEPAAADRMALQHQYTFPILVDPGSRVGRAYGLTGVPETFIIDKEGVLREKFIGPVQWDAPGARQMLMKYLAR